MRIIVGLVGKKGSGKTTATDYILHASKFVAAEVMIAELLKRTCSAIFGFDYSRLHSQEYKEETLSIPITPTMDQLYTIANVFRIPIQTREAKQHVQDFSNYCFTTRRSCLQEIGTEFLHTLGGKTIHCSKIQHVSNTKLSVVSDLRFKAEFDYFLNKKNQFIPIYLTRGSDSRDTHRSETEMETFKDQCNIVNNNGGLDELRFQLQIILRKNGLM